MKKNYLKKIYKYDDINKRFVIEISLDYYLEIFNDWDAAPIKKKELDPDFLDYLETAGEDIPLRDMCALVFVMPKEVENQESEEITTQVFRNYFNFLIHHNKRDISKQFRRALTYMITGFIFVAIAYIMQQYTTFFLEILSEGMFIGGWVFMWEAISLLFFKTTSLNRKIKRYRRFVDSSITYEYK